MKELIKKLRRSHLMLRGLLAHINYTKLIKSLLKTFYAYYCALVLPKNQTVFMIAEFSQSTSSQNSMSWRPRMVISCTLDSMSPSDPDHLTIWFLVPALNNTEKLRKTSRYFSQRMTQSLFFLPLSSSRHEGAFVALIFLVSVDIN